MQQLSFECYLMTDFSSILSGSKLLRKILFFLLIVSFQEETILLGKFAYFIAIALISFCLYKFPKVNKELKIIRNLKILNWS
jgi:hypothetical protein